MLLDILSRKEKLKFLDLALHMVVVDGEATKLEEKILAVLINEVGEGIADEYDYVLSSNVETTIAFFQECSRPVKQIVYLNLFNLTMKDVFYNTAEHFFLENILQKFEINVTRKKELMKLVFEKRELDERVRRVVKS